MVKPLRERQPGEDDDEQYAGFPVVKISDVPDPGPVRWLVEGLWRDRACGIIGGHPKAGKSWLLEYLQISVAAGRRVFDRYEVDQGRALLFNAEDQPGETKLRVRGMCRVLGVDFDSLDLHLIDVPGLRLDDAGDVEKLRRTVERYRPKFVGLDPLRNLHARDEDKSSDMAPVLGHLRLLEREFECAVAVGHHLVKDGPGSERRSRGQKLRGSSAFHGWLDSALYVDAPGEEWDRARHVTVEHRYAENVPPFAFSLQKAGDGNVCLEHFDREEATAANDDAAAEVAETELIQVLQRALKPLSGRGIRDVSGHRPGWEKKPLQSLVQAGTVIAIEGARGPVYWLSARPRK